MHGLLQTTYIPTAGMVVMKNSRCIIQKWMSLEAIQAGCDQVAVTVAAVKISTPLKDNNTVGMECVPLEQLTKGVHKHDRHCSCCV